MKFYKKESTIKIKQLLLEKSLDTHAALLYNLLFDSILKLSKTTKSSTKIKEQIYGAEVEFMTTAGRKKLKMLVRMTGFCLRTHVLLCSWEKKN